MGKQLRDALQAAGLVNGLTKPASTPKSAHVSSPGTKSSSVQPDAGALLLHKQTGVQAGHDSMNPRLVSGDPAPIRTRLDHDGPGSVVKATVAAAVRSDLHRIQTVEKRPLLAKTGPFHPNPLLDPSNAESADFPLLSASGIATELTKEPEDETDLIIGLDFGTSTTKVVIRDRFAAIGVFPIQFHPAETGVAALLTTSRVFRTGGVYSLMQGVEDIADLKLRLLACKAARPVTEFNDCCAFLALIIRRARATFFATYGAIYARHRLNWRLNLGLAARSYEDVHVVGLFRRLAWAAMHVAADADAADITVDLVDLYRRLSYEIFKPDGSGELAESEDIADVVPEVSAQLLGFMSSAKWDWGSRPVMMLVDVGAGTVDSALFHVRVPTEGEATLTFYSSRVEPNGVLNLHRARVDWLQSLLPAGPEHAETRSYLAAVALPTGRLRPLPEHVAEYLPGYTFDVAAGDIDSTFRCDRLRKQVVGSVNDAKVRKGLGDAELGHMPLLLCGGGSRMALYRTIVDDINTTPGWGGVHVELTRLPVPDDLVATGLHAQDFDRLSVAYGLSLSGHGDSTLGRIVRTIDVPDVQRHITAERDEGGYVSKDQM